MASSSSSSVSSFTSSQQSAPPIVQQTSPLLRLPRELRDEIYRYILVRPGTYIHPMEPIESKFPNASASWTRFRTHTDEAEEHHAHPPERVTGMLDTTIMAMNKQIYNEASTIMLTENTIYLPRPARYHIIEFYLGRRKSDYGCCIHRRFRQATRFKISVETFYDWGFVIILLFEHPGITSLHLGFLEHDSHISQLGPMGAPYGLPCRTWSSSAKE